MAGVLDQIHKVKEDSEKRVLELTDEIRKLEEERTEVENFVTAMNGGKKTTRRTSTSRAPRGKRKDQFLALVKERPGITVSDAATVLGIQPNYLYRIKSTLESEGKLNSDNGLRVVEPEPAPEATPESEAATA